jgi:hypothetical protein
MFGFRTEATIDRSASDVWSFLIDVERFEIVLDWHRRHLGDP